MGIICIWRRNKNPFIKYEQKQPKRQKYQQKKIVRKFLRKCMKNVIKMKKKWYLGLSNTWGQKSLEKFEEENDKQAWINLERKGRKR